MPFYQHIWSDNIINGLQHLTVDIFIYTYSMNKESQC